ncbi:MAG: matrixin family metalloprotease [Planctomycetes bacterium]|nr:matrixin family metalloprotease [Planctomycetota bacterium]
MRFPPLLPLVGLAGALALAHSPSSRGYALIGGALNLDHRDARMFENFTDPEALANQTPDPNFPGALGARLAIWKAAVEWGSMLHGSGGGDPTQPNDLGSGGANFDYAWQGLSTGVGGTDDKVNSEIGGGAGGVLAYCETPISDGWRIRYYSTWVWEGGPGANHTGIDLQGVACHELGHALGLAHTSVPGATMTPTITGNGSDQRSIEADDAAGTQAVYGLKSLAKPRISGYSVLAGVLTVQGSGFSPTNNEIWFTRALPQAFGTPVKVSGLVSTLGGTLLSAAIPAAAGPGDVLVRNNGSAHSNLSNAYPFDPNGTVPPPPAPPQIAALTPGTLQTFSGGLLTATGSGFALAKQVQVGTQFLAPGAFTILSDTQISFVPPGPTALGSLDVRVWNANEPGNAASFAWVGNTPPQLAPSAFAISGQPFTWFAGAGAGHWAVLVASATPQTVLLDGWSVLAFPTVIGVKPMSALGLGQFTINVPPGSAGITVYAQIGTFDPLPGVFAGTSSAVSTTVLF